MKFNMFDITNIFASAGFGRTHGVDEDMHVMRTFMNLLKDCGTGEYIERLLACLAAPTIMGMKPATLVNLRRAGDGNIASVWEERKDDLLRGMEVEAIEFPSVPHGSARRDSTLLMLYKRDLLEKVFMSKESASILAPLGYGADALIDSRLDRLSRRFEFCFPHEIGLFLGYPPEDVRGFIQNRGVKFLAVGYWKVYGDVDEARRSFQKFRSAEYAAACSFIGRPRAISDPRRGISLI
jgi:hypothetical protein